MYTHISVCYEQLKTLLDDLHESMNTEKVIEVWNVLIDDPCIRGRVDPYGVVHVDVCIYDIQNKLKVIKNPQAEAVMESWDSNLSSD